MQTEIAERDRRWQLRHANDSGGCRVAPL